MRVYLAEQWFLVALAVLIVIASQVQVPKSQQKIKEITVTYLCVSIIFLITGLTLPTKALLENYSRWKLHVFVQLQCFLMTSAIVFGVVSAAATNEHFMDPGLLIGLILMGSVATTIASNVVMTTQASGNQALTVVESTVGNFLGPFLTPLLVRLYLSMDAWYTLAVPHSGSGYGEVYRRVFKQLGLSIFVPIVMAYLLSEMSRLALTCANQVVGQIIQNVFPKPVRTITAKYKLGKLGSVCLLLIVWQTYDQAFSSDAFKSIKGDNMIFIVFVSIGLFAIFICVCFLTSILWLPKEDAIAVCYCVPAKGPAMGVPLANTIFVGTTPVLAAKIQIPIVIYQGLQIVAGSLLIPVFRRWRKGEVEEQQARNAEIGTCAAITVESEANDLGR